MLPKRKEPKRKSIAETLMRDIQGSAAEKLALSKSEGGRRICKGGPGGAEGGRGHAPLPRRRGSVGEEDELRRRDGVRR